MKVIKKSKYLYDWLNESRTFYIGMSIIFFVVTILFNMVCTQEERYIIFVPLIIALIMNFIWIYSIICSIYVNKHPEKFAYGEPYIVDLYYVKKIKVFSDLSKAENIHNASKSKAEEIVVQRTYKKNCFREVVTGKIFNIFSDGVSEECIGLLQYDSLVTITPKQLEEYIDLRNNCKYTDFPSFEECLQYYENLANEHYEKARKEADITDYAKKQKILNSIRK